MLELFRIESNNVAYDEDISMIIMAKTEERALEIAKGEWHFRSSRAHDFFKVTKVDTHKEQIVEVSHYGE